MISLALAIIDSSIYNNNDFPDWFQIGNFEKIPADAHPATHVYYVKYLYMVAYAVASKQFKLDGVEGLSLMRIIPNTIEPLITQATVQKTVLCEIYLRFSCAVAYYISGERARALVHLDKALSLAVADHLYGVITEYVRHFDGLLEERLKLINPEALSIISNLYRTYSVGWSKLSGAVRNRYVAFDLTVREREIAKLVAFGFTNKEISALLYLSESTVKQTIMRVVQKTGVNDKSEFAYVL